MTQQMDYIAVAVHGVDGYWSFFPSIPGAVVEFGEDLSILKRKTQATLERYASLINNEQGSLPVQNYRAGDPVRRTDGSGELIQKVAELYFRVTV